LVELTKKLGAKPGADVLVYFTTTAAELERRFAALKRTLGSADGLWIAYPRKASRLETDLDCLFDNKSAAVDEDWQAVRFVYRKSDRPR
jgi:hypothetical protein